MRTFSSPNVNLSDMKILITIKLGKSINYRCIKQDYIPQSYTLNILRIPVSPIYINPILVYQDLNKGIIILFTTYKK